MLEEKIMKGIGKPRALLKSALRTALLFTGLTLFAYCGGDAGNNGANGNHNGNNNNQGQKIEPGDLVINELYLGPGAYAPTKYYAEDDGYGPDGNPGYDACDKFVEVVNTANKTLNLDGVKIYSQTNERYVFPEVELEQYQAAIIFYRYEENNCGALPDVPDAKVLESEDYYFISAGSNVQAWLKYEDTTIDGVIYTASSSAPEGISLVRSPELTGFSGNQVELVKHPESPCVATKTEDDDIYKLAFSPGTCVSGMQFDTGCECEE
ncbi:hypothetical protein HZB88_02275 [archaeon]|nr:hypothetical protein [archaeon]